jgi:hypothetical protein
VHLQAAVISANLSIVKARLATFGYDFRLHIETKTSANKLSWRIENGITHNDIKVKTFSITPYATIF